MKVEDIDSILNVLFENNKEFIVAFLKNYDLPSNGTKDELKAEIKKQIATKIINPEDIVAYVNKIEGWGNQRIYLFKIQQSVNTIWKDQEQVTEILKKNRCLGLLNAERPLVYPGELSLSVIEWTPTNVKFVWIVKVDYDERVEDEDSWDEDRNLEFRAYRPRIQRGVVSLDWNLVSGQAMLMIQRMPTETIHKDVLADTWKQICKFIDSDMFKQIKLGKVIEHLEKDNDVRVRRGITEAANGLRADYRSKSKKHDAKTLSNYKKSKQALGKSFGYFGNFYWKVNDEISKEIHTNLYSKNNSILIFSQHPESEVRHVIECIVEYSKK